ncbi:MAG TPA: pyridoxal phosphate-dependent aminotransferase, partial [Polyangiaceae bacterium]|nr:pyridoxal phosphate-dependent aminotransferase [Polyangiaceae bacterium]
ALRTASTVAYSPEPFGLASARAAVAAELSAGGVQVDPEHVLLTASTSEAYAYALKLLADAGDRIWSAVPSYPLLEHLAQLEQVELIRSALQYDGAWHYPVLDAEATAGARALFVVNPNNPTGNFLQQSELEGIARLGLPLVSDEVFSAFALSPSATSCSALGADVPLVLVFGGLSKYVGLPQLKLSWMVLGGDPRQLRLARERLEIIADAFLSVATPIQLALPAIFESGATTRAAIKHRIRANLADLQRMADGSALSVLPVQGGWYAPLRLPATQSDDAWSQRFLEDCDVVVQPGWLYDFERPQYVVVSLITPEAELRGGFERILEAVAQDCS